MELTLVLNVIYCISKKRCTTGPTT